MWSPLPHPKYDTEERERKEQWGGMGDKGRREEGNCLLNV